jgi:glyoxylase-like metal-dependent hydrolase (beta-lactamase superfamily II)
MVEPRIKGHEYLNLPTYAFYIYHPRLGKRILFDMGARKDWWNLTPDVVHAIQTKGVEGMRITSDIDEILSDGGVDARTIDAVVWSHYHFDHTGNIQKFPKSTDVVVGHGFKEKFLPGYSVNHESPFYDADFDGRNLREITFHESSIQIGRLRAHDYFGDGSFYLLDTPGHTAGHISALVRTTLDTFILLGGDICHFAGMYRPSDYLPMPDILPTEAALDPRIPHPCPCSLFTACHPNGPDRAQTTPYYRPSGSSASWYEDPVEAQRSIHGMQGFDASDNVFVAIAHDPCLAEVCTVFPHGKLNDWKRNDWKTRVHWGFLNELPLEGKPGRPKLVEGGLEMKSIVNAR